MSQTTLIPEANLLVQIELDQEILTIGRENDCDLRITSPLASRQHARLRRTEQGYLIESLGKLPVEVNGKAVQTHLLVDGDHLDFAGERYVVSELSEPTGEGDEDEGQATIALPSQQDPTQLVQVSPTLLVEEGPMAEGSRAELTAPRTVVGRAADADISLQDQRISRHHFAIERRPDGLYQVLLLSSVNPLLVNGLGVRESRLFHGDILIATPFRFRFESPRPQDQRSAPKENAERTLPAAAASSKTRSLRTSEIGDAVREISKKTPLILRIEPANAPAWLHRISADMTALGSAEGSDVVLAGEGVSSFHATLERRDSGLFIVALSAAAPLFVNGARVEEARIAPNDLIRIGGNLLRVELAAGATGRSVSPQQAFTPWLIASLLLLLAAITFVLLQLK